MENQNCWWAGTGRWRRVPPIALVYPRSSDGGQTPLTITGLTIGTLQYMAPERFAGQEIDGRADVYSGLARGTNATPAIPFVGKKACAIALQLDLVFPPRPAASSRAYRPHWTP